MRKIIFFILLFIASLSGFSQVVLPAQAVPVQNMFYYDPVGGRLYIYKNKLLGYSQIALDADMKHFIDSCLLLKVDKVSGKGLSTNDFTTEEKTNLSHQSGTNTGDQTIPTTLPASDVYPWAKAMVKPSYAWSEITSQPPLFSGAYADLTGKPNIDDNTIYAWARDIKKPVYDYSEITGLPTLFLGSYTDLTNKPTLFSGSYSDLTNKPTIPAAQVQTDWNAVSGIGMLLNKPTLFSGSYSDLTNKPTIPAAQVQTDWNAVSGIGMLLNKPTLFSGSYSDLTNKPTIPTTLPASDVYPWAKATVKPSYAYSEITGLPSLFSGAYADLTGKPNIDDNTIYAWAKAPSPPVSDVSSGVYVPNLFNLWHTTGISCDKAYYSRIGNIVHVMVTGMISPTVVGGVNFGFSLPIITSNWTQGNVGMVNISVNGGWSYTTGVVYIDTESGTATAHYVSPDTNQVYYVAQFDYSIF